MFFLFFLRDVTPEKTWKIGKGGTVAGHVAHTLHTINTTDIKSVRDSVFCFPVHQCYPKSQNAKHLKPLLITNGEHIYIPQYFTAKYIAKTCVSDILMLTFDMQMILLSKLISVPHI